MMPATRDLFCDVATRYGVEPAEIIARCKPRRLLAARIEIARELERRGYNGPRIGAAMNRDYTTVYYYLGRIENKQPRPRPPPPPKLPKQPKAPEPRWPVRYAGWDRTEVHR